MNDETRTLFVLWQCRRTRQLVPVARLRIWDSGVPLFELAYVRGVARAMRLGFQPFVAFPDTGEVYRSNALFPFFRNRILSRTRPDYPAHVRSLGLSPSPDMIDLLGRSEGRRETDQVEVIPSPHRDVETGEYDVHFWARGVRHVEGAEDAIGKLASRATLRLMADPQNRANPAALLLCDETGGRVGYVPDYLVEDVHALLEAEAGAVSVVVERVNQPPIQPQRRLLCRLRSPWPPGFRPLASEELQSLVDALSAAPAAA